jgi:predicted unusual protein kinase regulating ubiquinone biosynthesis (AarF/ABC1/UbiB family)
MKTLKSIPTGKVERASKFITTGAKVGANYIKHYVKKAFDPELSKDQLNSDNAADIYESLSEMKGSVLKLAQMLSMDQGVLPKQYVDKFSMSQFQTPPISGPLVKKIFRNNFGKNPEQVFEQFNLNAKYAASIGQVHEAYVNSQKLAVKIQYPGVAESIKSDIKLVKPFAAKLMNVKMNDIERYIVEVESKLIEETNYTLELKQSIEISEACVGLKNLRFPKYYPEYSTDKILTMSWIEGVHMAEFMQSQPSQELRDRVGQTLWDFYMYQCHVLKKMHADPHPGNFIITKEGEVVVIDFGCVKSFDQEFYTDFWNLADPAVQNDPVSFEKSLRKLEMLLPKDDAAKSKFYLHIYQQMLAVTTQPFAADNFDFGDDSYMQQMIAMGEEFSKMEEFKNDIEPRGSNHFIYVNRTFYGLYSLLSQLKCHIKTNKGKILDNNVLVVEGVS